MRLFNTRTQSIEGFAPLANDVHIYVCGITPYDTTHIGHAFTYTSADVLIRYLELQGYKVRYVQNVTDIDDDILRKAKETSLGWRELVNLWTVHYIEDMQSLNVRPPDFLPCATDVIPEIVQNVHTLIEAGYGYISNGNVYFSVEKWPEFGSVSHIPPGEMLAVANQHGNRPDDPNKANPLDFVLWQAQVPGEPAWTSPWGPGRPGWHIECSTMSSKYLDQRVDVHGGGADLRFPHHECEAAQIEPIIGAGSFVRIWFHSAMVYYEGEKMSKSLGNLIMVSDLLKTLHPDALRLYLASKKYREEWSFTQAGMQNAAEKSSLLRSAMSCVRNSKHYIQHEPNLVQFKEKMDEDLDTPGAVEVMVSLAKWIENAVNDGFATGPAITDLRIMAGVFGMRLDAKKPEERVIKGWDNHKRNFV